MVKPKCPICFKALEGGYQRILYTEVDNLDIPEEDKAELKRKPEQVSYFAHDPKNIQTDVEVFAHRDCYEKVKAIYPDFDKPTQDDWLNTRYPVINPVTGSIELIKKDDFTRRWQA